MLGRIAETIWRPQPSKNQVALDCLNPQCDESCKGNSDAQSHAYDHAVYAKDVSLERKRNALSADARSLGVDRHPQVPVGNPLYRAEVPFCANVSQRINTTLNLHSEPHTVMEVQQQGRSRHSLDDLHQWASVADTAAACSAAIDGFHQLVELRTALVLGECGESP